MIMPQEHGWRQTSRLQPGVPDSGRKYLKFSPRKLRDTFITGNAFLSDEMVSVNKEVTWPATVNNLDLSALVSGGKLV